MTAHNQQRDCAPPSVAPRGSTGGSARTQVSIWKTEVTAASSLSPPRADLGAPVGDHLQLERRSGGQFFEDGSELFGVLAGLDENVGTDDLT